MLNDSRILTKRRRPQDFSPLVILSSLSFLVMLTQIIRVEDIFALLVYLQLVLVLAGVLYAKGLKIERDFPPSLFWLAFMAKLISTAVNYWFLTEFYGRGDANVYHRGGVYVAQFLSDFNFSVFDFFQYGTQGTTNMMFLTGIFYTILPPSLPGIYFLFAGLSFAGSVFFYRAYRIGFPDSSPNLFRMSIFFLPSILYWPSALGKDAWIFFSSGLVAYGLAKNLRQSRLSGLLWVGLGLLLISFIRPHITASMGIAISVAYIFFSFKSGIKESHQGLEVRLLGSILVIGFAFFAIRIGVDFLGLDEFSYTEVELFYDDIQERYLNEEGSNFQAVSAFTPTGTIRGVVTVLFRPFPWEAHNIPAIIASIESLLFLAAFWFRRRVFWSRISFFRKDSWLAFLLLYSLTMMLFLTVISNFGVLARQRVMLIPFWWMLFA